MKMNKKNLLVAAVASVGIASVIGIGAASAHGINGSSLADKIATKFNLNKSDVQQVIDQSKQDNQAQMEANYEQKLQDAVSSGKLTAEQKDKLIAKHKQLIAANQTNRQDLKGKTPAERKSSMDAKKAELTQWAKDNNVPIEYLNPGLGGGHGRGHGGMGMMGAPDIK
ncbi:MAG: hypothetical protein WCH00_02925 [Candidatus Saccharibacteria bacterium]